MKHFTVSTHGGDGDGGWTGDRRRGEKLKEVEQTSDRVVN